MRTSITSLPPETVELILFLLDPLDVAALSQTAHYFYDIIYLRPANSSPSIHTTNQYLWRNLYLAQPFDDPTTCYSVLGRRLIEKDGEEFDWKGELQEIIRARTIVESYTRRERNRSDETTSPEASSSALGGSSSSEAGISETSGRTPPKPITSQDRTRALRALLKLVTYVPPLQSSDDLLKEDKMSANLMWVAAECRRGACLDPLPAYPARQSERNDTNRNMLGSVFGESSDRLIQEDVDMGTLSSSTRKPELSHETDSDVTDAELQLRAKLHTYLGLTPYDWSEEAKLESRAYVYTMANYTWGNDFGPFSETWIRGPRGEWQQLEARVNWVHVHHIHRTMSMKLLEAIPDDQVERIKELDVFIYQLSFPYTQIILDEPNGNEQEATFREASAKGKEKEAPQNDWAGVTGQWKISFCFCDHGHLIRYNKALREVATSSSTKAHPPEAHTLSLFEVLRTMKVTLSITKVVDNPHFPDLPTIYFGGELDIGAGNGGNSVMNGWVRVVDNSEGGETDGQGKEDPVLRWHFVSGEVGAPIWSGEGVQIGGIKSAYGVLGVWTTIFHDVDDPVGPFWLRKQYDVEE